MTTLHRTAKAIGWALHWGLVALCPVYGMCWALGLLDADDEE